MSSELKRNNVYFVILSLGTLSKIYFYVFYFLVMQHDITDV
jgi:hypothetical protein